MHQSKSKVLKVRTFRALINAQSQGAYSSKNQNQSIDTRQPTTKDFPNLSKIGTGLALIIVLKKSVGIQTVE